MSKIHEELNIRIHRLGQFSKDAAELARGQKKLLDQTNASHKDYIDLLDDVNGAVAAHGG